jgi:GDP/UDP-N,N'-diacetylbacillosamine 2-epimerase (hydrolysing)
MKIGVLTSSRADYGIYLPLLSKLKKDISFNLEIIAFGTHLSNEHGLTVKDIEKDRYNTIHKISSLIEDDTPKGIAISYANTVLEFSKFWNENHFDLVLCLGDRFEMSAAVQASIPFNVKLAHIHGGETTLGAIDNIYRHQITLASNLHFVSSNNNMKKVEQLIGRSKDIHNVGSLSLNDINTFEPINKVSFFKKFGIKEAPYILVTFHPETVSFDDNIKFAKEMKNALNYLSNKINLIITMPNADTLGSVYRKELDFLKNTCSGSVTLIENFGKINYFNAMHYSSVLLGNTSSGIIEAASFNKKVINVGNRQKGRDYGENIYHVKFDSKKIIELTEKTLQLPDSKFKNIYEKRNPSIKIIKIIKKIF